jgi:hypothetical protein
VAATAAPSHRAGSSSDQPDQVVLNARFFQIQRALGFSLTEISSLTDKSIVVTPVFDRPRHKKNDVFVIMPFRPDNQEIYEIISVCCKKFDLSVARGDDIFGASHIMQDIWSLVVFAKVIICDCSHKNPNVFYEPGIAHTVGKPVILLTEKEDDIPFDLRHWRSIRYGSDKAALSNALMSSIQAILAGQI